MNQDSRRVSVFPSLPRTKSKLKEFKDHAGVEYQWLFNEQDDLVISDIEIFDVLIVTYLSMDVLSSSWTYCYMLYNTNRSRIEINSTWNRLLNEIFKLDPSTIAQLSLVPMGGGILDVRHTECPLRLCIKAWTPAGGRPNYGHLSILTPYFPCFVPISAYSTQKRYLLDFVFIKSAKLTPGNLFLSLYSEEVQIDLATGIEISSGFWAVSLMGHECNTRQVNRYIKKLYQHYEDYFDDTGQSLNDNYTVFNSRFQKILQHSDHYRSWNDEVYFLALLHA
jgi:hypothetical protein